MDSITHFLIPLAVSVVLSMLMKSAASAHAVSVGGRSTVGYGIGFNGYIRLHEMKSGVPSLLQELERRGIRTK